MTEDEVQRSRWTFYEFVNYNPVSALSQAKSAKMAVRRACRSDKKKVDMEDYICVADTL